MAHQALSSFLFFCIYYFKLPLLWKGLRWQGEVEGKQAAIWKAGKVLVCVCNKEQTHDVNVYYMKYTKYKRILEHSFTLWCHFKLKHAEK